MHYSSTYAAKSESLGNYVLERRYINVESRDQRSPETYICIYKILIQNKYGLADLKRYHFADLSNEI